MKKIIGLLAILILNTVQAFSQATDAEMQSCFDLRASGKIYVVITVIGIILAGLFLYLISTDRKVRKLEKKIKK